MRNWLLSLPCVQNGKVRVDVRGPWPVVLVTARPLVAKTVQTKDEAIMFLVEHLDR